MILMKLRIVVARLKHSYFKSDIYLTVVLLCYYQTFYLTFFLMKSQQILFLLLCIHFLLWEYLLFTKVLKCYYKALEMTNLICIYLF